MKNVLLAVTFVMAASTAYSAPSFDFTEAFALDDQREDALAELVPGTDDYFYFHCLHYQLTRDHAAFDDMLAKWAKERNGSWDARMQELRRRQHLLNFDQQAETTWNFLINEDLHIRFDHRPKSAQVSPTYPSSADPNRYGLDVYLRNAMGHGDPIAEFTDKGLPLAARQTLDGVKSRNLLARLTRSDLPNLVDLIIADLRFKDSRGFGHHPIHRELTLEQLETLAQREPNLLSNGQYVDERLARMQPGEEVDIENDIAAAVRYYTSLWDFVSTLDPQQNSHKALVLYRLLDAERRSGVYDDARFKRYLALPRNVAYVEEALRKQWHAQKVAWVNSNHQLPVSVPIPPIGEEEPLVRDFLIHLLKDAETPSAFATFFEEKWLNAIFAESKILHGKGDPEAWASKLTPAQYRSIQERIELDFALQNPRQFRPGDTVTLEVDVKNVEKLLVKVFEIQAFNYYKQHRSAVDQAIDLDGRVATHERTLEYDTPASQRTRRALAFPEINKRGVYVVELIGNGVSSRALVYIGKLEYLTIPTAYGQAIAVLNENGELVKQARLWMSGTEYASDEEGLILLPYSNAETVEFVILQDGDFSSPEQLRHLGESYSFSAGIFIEPQATGRLRSSTLILRPDLRVNGIPMDPAKLEEVVVTLRSVDAKGTPIEREFKPTFKRDQDWVTEFFAPDALRSLSVSVSAKVRQMRDLKQIDIQDAWALDLNSARTGDQLRQIFLVPSADGWFGEVRGVNGEPIANTPLNVSLMHPLFTDDQDLNLTTDADGRVALGPLTDLASISMSGDAIHYPAQPLGPGWAQLPSRITIPAGESIELPHPHNVMPAELKDVSLFQVLRGKVLHDAVSAVTVGEGRIRIVDIAPGTYQLTVHATGQQVEILVSDGAERFGFAIGNLRRLQLSPRELPLITKTETDQNTLKITLANADPSTRILAVARRFLDQSPEPDGGFGTPTPVVRNVLYPFTQYISGRNIGDEYRYVLERQFATQYPGSLLTRPGLILNPWMLRETTAERERLKRDEAYKAGVQTLNAAADAPMLAAEGYGESLSRSRERNARKDSGGEARYAFADAAAPAEVSGETLGYDFLPSGAILEGNLKPDDQGMITLALDDLDGHTYVDLYVTDRYTSSRYRVTLPDRKLTPRDQRLRQGLDPSRSFSRQKRVRALKPGDTIAFADSGTARHYVLQTVGEAFDLLQTLGRHAELENFAFLKGWPELTEDEKREKLSEFACHELHLFLHYKDPVFFKTVVAPYLANKKDKTSVDRWLLGEDLSKGFNVYDLNRRNALEQWLWSTATRDTSRVRNHFTEAWELLPPNPDARNGWILAALNLSGLNEGEMEETLAIMDLDSTYETAALKSSAATEAAARPGRMMSLSSADMAKKGGQVAAAKMAAPAPVVEMALMEADAKTLNLGLDLVDSRRASFESNDGTEKQLNGTALELRAEAMAGEKAKRLYRKLPRTTEWAEQNYYKLRASEDVAQRIPPSEFWKDVADGQTLSPSLISAHRTLTEVIAALAVSDLRFEAPEIEEQRDGAALTLKVGASALLVSEEVLPAEKSADDRPLLLSQQFFRPDDPYRFEGNEQIEKFVDTEFVRRTVYGGRVTLTNPTASRRRLNVLLQIPLGAVPLRNGFYTDDRNMMLEPYTTQTIEYFFYFPEAGEFPQFPAHAAVDEAVVGKADARIFTVVEAPTQIDRTSWDWISQNADEKEVLAYLNENNLRRLELDLMAWRLGNKDFFDAATRILEDHLLFHETTYRYAFKHRDTQRARVWMEHHSVAGMVGPVLDSPLLTVNPVERVIYEHLEYDPLVNPRAHKVGAELTILNTALRGQYANYLSIQTYKDMLSPADRLALVYYLALQDRLTDAIKHFERVESNELVEKVQYDYMAAWLALRQLKVEEARNLAAPHVNHPVKRWRTRFQNLVNTIDEASGEGAQVADTEDRQQDIDRQAAREPAIDMSVEADVVTLTAHNLKTCTLNFYPMDIELLFSRKPFLAKDGGDFAVIRPSLSKTVTLKPDGEPTPFKLPADIRDRNMMIEAVAAGLQRSEVYYANRLKVRLIENYGQVEVTSGDDGTPLPKTYIKVYARTTNGQEEFWKDGYTDLRGRFDYVSLNDRDPNEVEALSILILHDEHGALIKEAVPPKQ